VVVVVAIALVAAAAGVGAAVLVLERSGDDEPSVEATSDTGPSSPSTSEPGPGAGSGAGSGSGAGAGADSDGDLEDTAALFERVRSGVVRIRASSCAGTGAGTGFLIAEDRVATAAHVVSGAVAVSVETEGGTHQATVEGIDDDADLAALRLSAPVPGHVFDFTEGDPAPGTGVAIIGHPLDGPVSIREGTVSGVHREIDTGAGTQRGLLQTDAAMNEGDSGGPVLTAPGDVAGVMSGTLADSEGLGFAVESTTADPWFAGPSSSGPTSVVAAGRATPLGPEVVDDVPVPGAEPWAAGAGAAFDDYFGGINSGDYQRAWDRLSPDRQDGTSLDEFAAGVRTSFDFGFTVQEAWSDGRAHVWLEFTSIQDPSLGPEPGESCTRWSLDYVLDEQAGGWFVIDEVTGHGGADGHEACL
jgi:S1-C subfamily serine protease